MSIINYFKKTETKQSILAIAIFLLISIFYFSPLLNKKVLQQSDTILVQGMSKNIEDFRKAHNGQEPYWSTTMFSGMPSYTISANYRGNLIQYLKIALDLGLPHPIGILFIGMTLFFFLGRSLQIPIWISAGGSIAYGFTTYHILIMEAGHYQKIYALMYAPGVVAGLIWLYQHRWLLGSLFLFVTLGLEVYAAHIQMTYYLLFVVIPLILYFGYQAFIKKELKKFMIASGIASAIGVLSLIINANNLYPLYQYQKLSIRGASELASTKEELKTGGLDKDYAYAWSQGRVELTTFLIPNAVGGASGSELGKNSASYKVLSQVTPNALEILKRWPTYWGDQSFTSGPYYSGILTVALAILALYVVPTGIKFPLLYAIMLSFLLALGKNSFSVWESLILLFLPVLAYFKPKNLQMHNDVYATVIGLGGLILVVLIAGEPGESYRFKDLFFDYLPLYNKFRVPSSMLVIAQLALPILAILGLYYFIFENQELSQEEKLRKLYLSFGVLAGILGLLWLMPGILYEFTCPQDNEFRSQLLAMTQNNKTLVDNLMTALQEDRESMLRSDALRSLFYLLVFGGLLWAFVRGSISNQNVVMIAFAVLTFLDLYSLSRRYLNNESYSAKKEYSLNFQPREADEYILSIDKSYYRVFPLDRNPFNDGRTVYHLRSIGGYNAAKIKRYQQMIEKHLASTLNPYVINMLNTKYVITSKPLNSPQYLALKKMQDGETVYLNLMNNGAAWFVEEVLVVNTPDEALDTLTHLDTRKKAVIENKDKPLLQSYSKNPVDSTEVIEVQVFDNNYMKYKSISKEARFGVFSEVYYNRGWKAFIDGKEVPILHTNFVLRGLNIPAGEHTIEFKFEPEDVKVGEMLSYIGSGIMVLMFLVAIFWFYKNKKNFHG
jgi:hypothetical protein